MSKVIGPFRHTGAPVPLGLVPARGTRDAVRRLSAVKRGTTDAAAKVVAQLAALGRRVETAGTAFDKVSGSFDRLADTAHRVADSRRGRT